VTVAGTPALFEAVVARSQILLEVLCMRGACLLPLQEASLRLWVNFCPTRNVLEWQAAMRLWEVRGCAQDRL
jgi:hypothetical protein